MTIERGREGESMGVVIGIYGMSRTVICKWLVAATHRSRVRAGEVKREAE